MAGLGNLINRASEYLKINKERFNEQEKEKFNNSLKEFLCGEMVVADEVYDFLQSEGFITSPPRATTFAEYIKSKYPLMEYKKVLDVGAGRLCHLSKNLADVGYQVFAIDPNIRISNKEAELMKIKHITKLKFVCDKFAETGKGTDITDYDFLIGLEPCDATEHIIHQGLKHDKPFDVQLCYAPHNALDGRKFKSVWQWYEYLQSISKEINIINHHGTFVATNNPITPKKEAEKENKQSTTVSL